MAKYRVLVIAMTIKGNKIAKFDEIVEDTQLNSSPVDLVKDGFIEEVKHKKSSTKDAEKEALDSAKSTYAKAKEDFDALTDETSDEDRDTVTNALKDAIEELELLGEDVSEFQKVFSTVEDTQLDLATEQLKLDYLAAVKEKSELPKDTKPADLAKAGGKIADLKANLVTAGVEFDTDGNIVNPPAKN